MFHEKFVVSAVIGVCLTAEAFAQAPKVDFGRDVRPIFQQNCISCHGPALASNGLRLDRKSSVLKQGARRVVPGGLENSFLYSRVAGVFGQMPPGGPLRPEQVAMIKTWIEQGAEWPEILSHEAELAPLNPKAVAAVETLRGGDEKGFLAALRKTPGLVNARGPEGSTPLMYAALYGDASMLEMLLKKGANPNLKNDAGATALLWAATSLEKTRVLLAHGAQVNAISDGMRTPLMVAASTAGGLPIVKLLLERGANLNPTKNPASDSSPLAQAALSLDPEIMQLLISRGADVKASAASALPTALLNGCSSCADLLMKQDLDKQVYSETLSQVASFADANTIRTLLDHGANVDAPDPFGRTPLMMAAGSDIIPSDVVKVLIDRGADIKAKSSHPNSRDTGMSVLDIALLRGETPLANLLAKAGSTSAVKRVSAPKAQPLGSVRSAIERSLPLLQRADEGFTSKTGCISCHNNSLAAMTVGLARTKGFPVNEKIAQQQVKFVKTWSESRRDRIHQITIEGPATLEIIGPHGFGYFLIGLHAEGQQPSLDTDAFAMYLKYRQMLDGSWPSPVAGSRPPLDSYYIGQTVLAMRGLQLYAPKAHKAEYEKAVGLAAAWVSKAEPRVNEDYLWKLLGLAWAGRDKEALSKTQRAVLALQGADGGWGDMPSMSSNAYATGKALYALHASGISVSDPVYRRGMDYLLSNQMADGSWHVPTRSLGFQPYFETGFPHGIDQSISAAGTSWATMALILGSSSPADTPKLRADAR